MCELEKDGVCYAKACYSSEQCGARDGDGNPVYASNEAMKAFYGKSVRADRKD